VNDQWKEWVNNKIELLSTPLGAGIGIGSFVIGILIGKIFLMAARGF